MATLLLSAAGAALGGAVGGSFASIGSLVLGKAAGAVLGSAIDQKLLGQGSAPVETGRVDRFRVMGSSEGAALARGFGRSRVAGQLIWSSRFLEAVSSERVGGKGGGASVREYSYSVSLAIALCGGRDFTRRAHLGGWPGCRSVGRDVPIAPRVGRPVARPADRGHRGSRAGLPRDSLHRLRESRPDSRTAIGYRSSTSRSSAGPPRGCLAFRGRRHSISAASRLCPEPVSMPWRPSPCTSSVARATTSS